MTELLNPFALPLSGVRLIEASAGTGKTYTITTLYLRLVLGHDCEALSPENILVVTFTRAATEELRDRIRKRLKQAHDALKFDALGSDPFMAQLETWLQQDDRRERALQRLHDAQQLMDLAAIFTIHGFCQRMLAQYAFEARGGFEDQLTLEESPLISQAVRDVWRSQVYPMDSATLDVVLQKWRSPDALANDIRPFIHKDVTFYLGKNAAAGMKNGDDFDALREQWLATTEQLAQTWTQQADELKALLEQHPQKNGQFTRYLDTRMAAVTAVLERPHNINKDDLTKFEYFCAHKISGAVKKGNTPPSHNLLTHMDAWWQLNERYQAAKTHWLNQWMIDMIEQSRSRLTTLKQQQQLLAPDDLLTGLANAIAHDDEQHLICAMRQQFPVAMVDEFQDTDALQYQIFRAAYVSSEAEKNLALLMIGDPKQAIYKFRGADIFTYIQAKHEVDGAYSLDTNYRSSQAMVDAVNQIFTQHDQPFLYDADIPFIPVRSANKGKPLCLSGREQPALTWQVLRLAENESATKETLNTQFAEATAETISQLLNASVQGDAQIDGSAVQAKDLAVLVRSGRQAQFIKAALTARGIPSVYVGRDSIFASAEAHSLYEWMCAVHEQSERRFKNALAHPLWGMSLDELTQLNHDERRWEIQLDAMHQAQKDWQSKGVMTMVSAWLHSRELPGQWLQDKQNGERCLTNILHLAEILQQAAVEQQGQQGLLSWFAQQLVNANGENETQQLRLESDENLVQITTLHKSKGLEYPIVFMPFLWDGKDTTDKVFYNAETQQPMCDMVGDYQANIQQEALAEEIRLLYVGLTRAVSRCYVAVYHSDDAKQFKTIDKSALKYCLLGHERSFAQGLELLQQVSQHVPEATQGFTQSSTPQSWSVETITPCVTPFNAQQHDDDLVVREFNGEIPKQWRLASFSSLIKKAPTAQAPQYELDDDSTVEQPVVIEVLDQTPQAEKVLNAFTFPRGAHAGNFLHNLLEDVEFTHADLAQSAEQDIETREQAAHLLERYGFDVDTWLSPVLAWLHDILTTPLSLHEPMNASELSLSQLSAQQKLVEMEFYFPVSQLRASQLNALLRQHPCLTVPFGDVDFAQLKGMLKGFVDLIFEWQGQYFILDYKSNHLGDDETAYHPQAVHMAMAKNRYDVQMVIYTLALHRMLKLRISDYDYDRHIGGGYYLFLRAMGPNQREPYGQYFHKPDRALIEALDQLISDPIFNASETAQEGI